MPVELLDVRSPVRPISIPSLEFKADTLSLKMYRLLLDELTYVKKGRLHFRQIRRQQYSTSSDFRHTLPTV